jgi:hypothetical protein
MTIDDAKRLLSCGVYVHGICDNRGRAKLIERAITEIQKNSESAMKEEFIGMKNYAGFGDQECDCSYGYGPKHGSIVFKIGREGDVINVQDAITLLGIVLENPEVNVCKMLQDYVNTNNKLNEYKTLVDQLKNSPFESEVK